MKMRIIVCPIIENNGKYLLCKMVTTQGVFPGQWALPGGGVELNETIEDALRREIKEELGDKLIIDTITEWTFRDDIRLKTYATGEKEEIYMIYLIYDCVSINREVHYNEEFSEIGWFSPSEFNELDLNDATQMTLKQKGFI